MIKPVGDGKYVVMNAAGTKPLSKPMSKSGAEQRLQEIEYFKHHPSGGNKHPNAR